jgi:signal peptide peptidase SppA
MNRAHLIPIEPYWAIEEAYAHAAADVLATLDLSARRVRDDEDANREADRPYTVQDGVALFSLDGPLTKQPTCASFFFGGTATAQFRQALRQAASDPQVRAILLDVDSPGGTVAGTADLADDVFRIAAIKPVYGYISDQACSAALWIVSQATHVFANATAIIGSIGVVSVVQDKSRMYENAGIKVHVISTGPHKGAGASGTPITPAQLTEMQRTIDSIQEEFIASVARGRRMDTEAVRALADGRLHVGKEAVALGLVDGIASIDQVFARLAAQPAIRMQQQAALPAAEGKSAAHSLSAALSGTEEDEEMSKPNLWDQLRNALSGGGEATESETIAAAQPVVQATPVAVQNSLIAAMEAEIARLRSEADFGRRAAEELRKDAKAQAIRAYGATLGVQISQSVDALDPQVVAQMRDAWRAEADQKYGIGRDGQAAGRASAPAAVPRISASAESDDSPIGAGSNWERLTAEQKKFLRLMNRQKSSTPEGREELAYYVLNPDVQPKALAENE